MSMMTLCNPLTGDYHFASDKICAIRVLPPNGQGAVTMFVTCIEGGESFQIDNVDELEAERFVEEWQIFIENKGCAS